MQLKYGGKSTRPHSLLLKMFVACRGRSLVHKTLSAAEFGKVHFALPARLLVDDTHAYIHMDFEGGNPVSAPGVGSDVPLVAVALAR